tara:strand:+ start:289 stop:465 length:177 start_codon:yes stop_codon:yes gene_type:complete
MYKFKCPKCDAELETTTVVTKYVPGLGAIQDVKCKDCDVYMNHTNPMKGAPKFYQKPT